MSLDVYLKLKNTDNVEEHEVTTFIREDGQTKEISLSEWNERFPGKIPFMPIAMPTSDTVYSSNITHNLNTMADEAGIYDHLWRPDEIGIAKAEQLIEPLRIGLRLLSSDPKRFKKFNPENGWGTYEVLVNFVKNYLEACELYPTAEVSVWR